MPAPLAATAPARAIAQCPDHVWGLIVVLARYGGLRIPSELLSLRWADVNLAEGRMMVRSPKVERHGSGIRFVPIFPEVRPYLEESQELARRDAEHVVSQYRQSNANLRQQFTRILLRAGVNPWPKLFVNMQSSRVTELLDAFPVRSVAEWMGHSPETAQESYAQSTRAHFEKAVVA